MIIGFTGIRKIEALTLDKVRNLYIKLENLREIYENLTCIHGCAFKKGFIEGYKKCEEDNSKKNL